MGLSGRRPSLGLPPPVRAAMRRADASTEWHSGKAAGHKLLEAAKCSRATFFRTVAPAATPASGLTCTYPFRGELAGAATVPRAVSDAIEDPDRLAHYQWLSRLAFMSKCDDATPPAPDWPRHWAPASLVCACSAPPHASAANVTQWFPGSEPAAADTSPGALVALLWSTPLLGGRPRRALLGVDGCAPPCSRSSCSGGATDGVGAARADPAC